MVLIASLSGSGSPAIIAARLCFAVTMFFTYPLEAYVARHALEEIWVMVCELRHWPIPRFTWVRHLGLTVLVVALSLGIAILVGDNLGVVLELSGSFNAVALSLVLPALVYLKIVPGPLMSLKKIPAIVMLVFGVFDGVASTILIIIGVASGH
jgi:sodium-coupled neutral amino acid transporter 11